MMTKNKHPLSLYVHVPFCNHICFYCDFSHVLTNPKTIQDWLSALKREYEEKKIAHDLKTIYIGGGTPSALDVDTLEAFLSLFDSHIKEIEEYTIEVNPESITKEKVECFLRHGINRISMGMQTSNDALLKEIGRTHTFEQTKQAMRLLKEVGFTNISLDLMYSLPKQTMEDLVASVHEAIKLEPTHISIYSLTIEENTVFGKKGVKPLEGDLEADMYFKILELLPQYGYQQYEISNFSLPGYESKHNLCYWNYEDFYGLGCGASGKENNIRYDKPSVLNAYLKNPLACTSIEESKEEQTFNAFMMGLRKKEGIYLPSFEQTDIQSLFGERINDLIHEGLLERNQDYLRCTKEGLPILNTILVRLLD